MLRTTLALGTFALTLGIAGLAGAIGGTPFFSLWTNLLFLWPVVRAIELHAYSEAIVFSVTLIVSFAYHACVADALVRAALAPSFFVLLGLAMLIIIAAAALAVWRKIGRRATRRPSDDDDDDDTEWPSRAHACVIIAAATSALAVIVAASVAAASGLDGCLYPGPHVPALVTLWRTTDFTTALASLVAVTIHGIQIGTGLELGVFWLVLALAILVNAFVAAGLAPAGATYAILGVALGLLLVARLIACCAVPHTEARAAWRRYSWWDAVGGVLVGATALIFFLTNNTSATHGWWHALAALALFFVMDAVVSIRESRTAARL